MAGTIRENIFLDIVSTLEDISKDNGYNNDIESVQRWRQKGNSLAKVPCIVVNAGPEDKKPEPNPLTTCELSIFIDVWIRDDSDATDSVLNSLFGDIETALTEDITRGGYAVETQILSAIPFESIEGQSYAGLIIELKIIYRHEQTDPETSG